MDRTRPPWGDGEQGLSRTPGARLIVIENLEWWPTRWLLAEYSEAARVAGEAGYRLLVTGAENPVVLAALRSRGIEAVPWRGYSLDSPRCILLDLEAVRPLEPWEASAADCIVVGGIMGDHPPRGRTRLLRLVYRAAARRHLGPHQFSVDGAVKMALLVASGLRLREIPVAVGVSLEVEAGLGRVEVELPYAYPLRRGRPWVAGEVVELLSRGIVYDEEVYGLP